MLQARGLATVVAALIITLVPTSAYRIRRSLTANTDCQARNCPSGDESWAQKQELILRLPEQKRQKNSAAAAREQKAVHRADFQK